MAKRHFLDMVVDDIKRELPSMIEAGVAALRDVVPVGHVPQPRRRERVERFLMLDEAQRQAMFLEMGPSYAPFVTKMMGDIAAVYGPYVAQEVMPLYATPPTEAAPLGTLEEGILDLLGLSSRE